MKKSICRSAWHTCSSELARSGKKECYVCRRSMQPMPSMPSKCIHAINDAKYATDANTHDVTSFTSCRVKISVTAFLWLLFSLSLQIYS